MVTKNRDTMAMVTPDRLGPTNHVWDEFLETTHANLDALPAYRPLVIVCAPVVRATKDGTTVDTVVDPTRPRLVVPIDMPDRVLARVLRHAARDWRSRLLITPCCGTTWRETE